MAVLSNADYSELRKSAYQIGKGKEELNALSGGLPNETQFKAGFQALEDYFTSNFATIKSNLDTALQRTTTNTGAQKMLAAYLIWKIKQILG